MQKFWALGAPPPDPRASRGRGPLPPTPPSSGGWGLRPQTPKQPPQSEFLATPLLSALVCYARIPPTSIRTVFSNYCTYICNNIPLQERLFSSCTYQKESTKSKES